MAVHPSMETERTRASGKLYTWEASKWAYLLLASAILLFAAIRIRLLQFPLERDEGEYAYGGQLILRGIVPYQLCYAMKFPGTALAQALIEAVFGQSPEGVHLGLLVVSSATIVLVFFLAKRLFGEIGAVVASTSFGLLAVSPAMLGFAAHASQFVILPAVGGTLLLLRAQESGKLALFFLSGVLFGLAVLMKQPGVLFVFFGIFWVAVGAVMPKLHSPHFANRSGIGESWRGGNQLWLRELSCHLRSPVSSSCGRECSRNSVFGPSPTRVRMGNSSRCAAHY